ncbi:hypothetical protein VTN96DRAFT_5321 [Rasamsonia emersonii]
MDLPPLSFEQLSKVLAEAPTAEALWDMLSQYENEACLQFTDTEVTGDPKLLSAFYASFLISHLLSDQIHEARAMTTRMPPTLVKDDMVLQNSITLLRAVYQNKYAEVYRILRQLPWPEPVNQYVQKYDAYFAEKTFKEISRAYEAIRAERAATYLGLEEEIQGDSGEPSPKLIQILTQRGWVWDADEHLFRPKVQDKPADLSDTKTSGLNQLVGLVSGYGG